MKVLHILGELRPSGMERMLVSAAPYFRQQHIQSLILGQGSRHTFRSELESAGYPVAIVPSVKTVHGARALHKAVAVVRPDVVHIHTEGAFALTTLIAHHAAPSAQIARTIHNVFLNQGIARLSRLTQARLADRFVSIFVAPSNDVAAAEMNQYHRQCVVVENWVDDRFLSLAGERSSSRLPPSDPPLLVMVGNCSPIKNHTMVLRAIMNLPHHLALFGDEREAPVDERRLLDQLERAGRLDHRGTGDPGQALVRGTAFLMPSLHEGFGVALAEAITVGIPALISDRPGTGWARDLNGVRTLSLDPAEWRRAIENLGVEDRASSAAAPPNLTAQRGALEYARIYKALLGSNIA